MPHASSQRTNAMGEPLICAKCGGVEIVPLTEIGLRWKLVVRGYRMYGFNARLKECDLVPDGYGIAYYPPDRNEAVLMPIPFNLVVGFWIALVHWVKCPPWRYEARKAEFWREQGRKKQARIE